MLAVQVELNLNLVREVMPSSIVSVDQKELGILEKSPSAILSLRGV
jgi:hypothetical protein